MFVINTSFHVHKSIEDSFLIWLKEIFIKSALCDDAFSDVTLMRLLLEVQEDSSSFSVGLLSEDLDSAFEWNETKGADLLSELLRQFGSDKVVFFTTCMQCLPLH